MKNLVFSFVLLLGLFSCGEEKSSSSFNSNNASNKPANGSNSTIKNVNEQKSANLKHLVGTYISNEEPRFLMGGVVYYGT